MNEIGFQILFLYLIVLNLFLAGFIYFRNPKANINRSFAILSFALSGWMLTLFFSLASATNELIWTKLSFFTQLVIIIDAWFLSFIYPREQKLLQGAALIFGTAYFLVFAGLLFFSPWWVDQNLNYGNAFLLYTTISWIPIAWTMLNFNVKLHLSQGLEKVQLRYVFLAYSLWAIGANFLANIFNLNANRIAQLSFAALASLVFTVAIFYAIARYRLLDIRWLVSKAIVYSLLFIIMIVLYTFALYVFGLYFYQTQLTSNTLIVSLSLAVLAVGTAFPLKNSLEKATHRSLLQDKLKQTETLAVFSRLFDRCRTLPELMNDFTALVQKSLNLASAAVAIRIDSDWKIYPASGSFSADCQQAVRSVKPGAYIIDELKEGPITGLMHTHRCYYLNVIKQPGWQAIFMGGYKHNGDIYFEDERHFLSILMTQWVNTTEKVIAFTKMQTFNRRLAARVSEATVKLRQVNRRLTDALKLKDEVISIVSHELVVPMVATSGSLSTILEGYTGRLTTKTRDFLQAIYNENMRLVRLTKNLLSISRIRDGRIRFVSEVFNPARQVQEVVDILLPLAQEKNLSLTAEIAGGAYTVKADRDKLKEILINLIDNAIRYTRSGRIIVGCRPDKKEVHFWVKDTGKGMTAAARRSLFADLDLLNNDKIFIKKGRGLGLYICHQLLTGMQGKMTVESEEQRGTQFSFWLPGGKTS